MSAPEPLVRMRGVVKLYPGVLAVDRADIDIFPSEVLGLVGKNGAGKSTVIKILAGAVRPDAGEITVGGVPLPPHYAPHRAQEFGLAFMHQELHNVPLLSVAENVALGSKLPRAAGRISWRALRRQVEAVLAELEQEIDVRRPVAGLSQAQQRMVMIARALYHRAKVLVLDEPTASLTDDEIARLHAVVRRLAGAGVAVVYVSHRLNEVVDLTDRVVVMRDGRVEVERPTRELDRRSLIAAIVGDAVSGQTRAREERPARAEDAPVLLRARGLGEAGGPTIDLELRAGEILGLGGLVGAGRTEIARLLAGAATATTGTLEVDGQERRLRSPRQGRDAGVVLLPEDRRHEALVLDFSVRENITLASLDRLVGRFPWTPSRSKERIAAAGLIERLQIRTGGTETPVATLSGGNQQKVVLARWLDLPVKVMIFDEPTAGIDVQAKEEFFSLMQGLADAGKGIILISSDFSELVHACDRVLVLREGRASGELMGAAITEQAIVELCYAHDGEADAA